MYICGFPIHRFGSREVTFGAHKNYNTSLQLLLKKMNITTSSANTRPAKRTSFACTELNPPTPVTDMSEDAFVKAIFGNNNLVPSLDVIEAYHEKQHAEAKDPLGVSNISLQRVKRWKTAEDCAYMFIRTSVRFNMPESSALQIAQKCIVCGERIHAAGRVSQWRITDFFISMLAMHESCVGKECEHSNTEQTYELSPMETSAKCLPATPIRAATLSTTVPCSSPVMSTASVNDMTEDEFVKEIFGDPKTRLSVVEEYYNKQTAEREQSPPHNVVRILNVPEGISDAGGECAYMFIRAAVRFSSPSGKIMKFSLQCSVCGERIHAENRIYRWRASGTYIMVYCIHKTCLKPVVHIDPMTVNA